MSEPLDPPARSSRTARASAATAETLSTVCRGLSLASLVFLVFTTARAKQWIHPDCALYLHSGELILDGQIPYVDFIELNPPLVMYLHVVPVAIARALGLSSVVVFNVLVSLFAGYGAWAWLRFLPRITPRMSEPYRHVVANIWLGFSFLVFIAGHWSLPIAATGTDYGQREHLIVLGYVPFMLLRMVRWRDREAKLHRAESIFMGAVAGVVLCLKPHFILAAVLVEIHLLVENRRWRPLISAEVWSACAVAIGYALHFFVMPASMRSAFFDRWLPLASSRYGSYNWPWDHVFSLETLHVVVLLAVVVWLPWRAPYRSIARRVAPLATFGVGSALAMISQHKGWPYHIIPMTASIYLTSILVVAEVMQLQTDEATAGAGWAARAQGWVLRGRAPALILLIGAWYGSVVRHSPALFQRYDSPTLALIRQVTAPGDAVTYLTTAVQTVYPEALHAQRLPGSRYLWTFPIAFLFEGRTERVPPDEQYEVPAGREAERDRLLAELAEDIATRRPKLVFMWRGTGQGCPPGFNVRAFFEHNRFSQSALADYTEARQLGFWSVFARKDVVLPFRGVLAPQPNPLFEKR